MQPITRQRLAEIPDLTTLAALDPQRYPCLLQSAVHDSVRSRWDILLAFPQSVLQCFADGSVRENDEALASKGFLSELDKRWQAVRSAAVDDELPFHGGWALYLAYELAAEAEPGLKLPRAEQAAPVAVALRCPAAVLVDHQRGEALLVAESDHLALIDQIRADIDRARSVEIAPLSAAEVDEDPDKRFLDAVGKAHEYICAGDVFQVNLSRTWRARFASCPQAAAVYRALCRANPAPFACLWQQPGWAVISSSPERLVEIRGRQLQTRPIAGTRPR
ncbi:MAG: chorismate-binding protein, partial [Rhodanobacteraceae bacterium]